MTFEAYINPDFGWIQKLIFLLAALAGIVICIILILAFMGVSVTSHTKSDRRFLFYEKSHNRIQQFYELIIAGTSVLSFACAYVVINHIYSLINEGASAGPILRYLADAWANGRDFILLLLICLSCVLNSILDKLFIPLKRLSGTEKATIRMLAMFYCIIILVFLDNIGDESEYNPVMMYYLGLMVGRFVYFDASFADFWDSVKKMFVNLPLLIMTLALTGALCFLGFDAGFLLERNYYIVGVFYTHLFMLAVVFLLKLSHLIELIISKPRGYDSWAADDESDYEYDDDDPGDDDGVTDYDDPDDYDEYSKGKDYEEVLSRMTGRMTSGDPDLDEWE